MALQVQFGAAARAGNYTVGWWTPNLTSTDPNIPYLPLESASAAVSGTITASVTETDIVAGGETIILTLTGAVWVITSEFDAIRLDILQGLDSAQAEGNGWNVRVRDTEVAGAVVRTSDTVVTITLTASASYNITAQETITVTIPPTALQGSIGIIAAPTFTVDIAVGGPTDVFFALFHRIELGIVAGTASGMGGVIEE